MRRHPHRTHVGIAALLLAWCVAAAGQWSGIVITNYPRGYRPFTYECYSAAVERCVVAGVASPAAPAWWRSQRSNLVGLKAALKSACTNYVIGSNVDSNGTFVTWGNANAVSGIGPLPPTWTPTGLCWQLQLPTNYFDYTPYRLLTVGRFTNDPTRPTPYGFQNASTAKGGTNYPAGWTNWTTTEYGWPGFSSVVAQLYFTMSPYILYDAGNPVTNTENLIRNWSGSSTVDCSTAISAAQGNSTNPAGNYLNRAEAYTRIRLASPTNFIAIAHKQAARREAMLITTNISQVAILHWWVTNAAIIGIGFFGDWHDLGSGYELLWNAAVAPRTGYQVKYTIGATNWPTDWPACTGTNAYPGYYWDVYQGWGEPTVVPYTPFFIHSWSNGFSYK